MKSYWISCSYGDMKTRCRTLLEEFPPGNPGRYYLIHVSLLDCCDAFLRNAAARFAHLEVSDILTRYTLGMQPEYFTRVWIGTQRPVAASEALRPIVHVLPDNRPIPLIEPKSALVPIEEYTGDPF
jgi:hypothetical protein